MGPRQRHSRSRAKTHAVPVIIASFFGFLLIAGAAFGIGMIGVVDTWLQDLPDYTDPSQYLSSEPTTVLDAKGNKIASFYTQNRTTVDLDQISKYVIDGTVDTEDERFYEHGGFDLVGIFRAAVSQITGGSEGASTITQQLVRNTILSDEQFDITLQRKVREIYLAVKMEEIYSKDQILNMYLNVIYYGHGAYGIEAAAQTYFSKSAKDLSLAEAALLVGLPNAPSQYDPTVHPDLAVQRRNTVLRRMLRNGSITQDEYDKASAEELKLDVSEVSGTGVDIKAYPYFVDYVRALLSNEFDYDQIFKGGLTVQTTIDPDVQKAAEAAVIDRLDYFNENGLESGMTVIDNTNGHIVGMVGGKNYNADSQHTNHAITQRQTGSSFKAFTLATALSEGMNPDIVINCTSPQTFDDGKYRVQNVDNTSYGYISLARATEVSSNTGYVQAAKAVGIQNVIDTCHKLGIEDEMKPYSSLTLGTENLSTLQMAEAYSTFAMGGKHRDAVAITKITNRDGDVLYEHKDDPEQVLDSAVAAKVVDILEGVVQHGTATVAQLSVDQPFGGKTGTTDNTTDLWFCGFTPQYTLSVWCGHSGSTKSITLGGRRAYNTDLTLPIARNFLNTVLSGAKRAEFPKADGKITYKDNSVWEVDGKKLEYGSGGSGSDSESSSDASSNSNSSNSSSNSGSSNNGTNNSNNGNNNGGGSNNTTQPSTPSTDTPTTPTTPTEPGGGNGGSTGGGGTGGSGGGTTGGDTGGSGGGGTTGGDTGVGGTTGGDTGGSGDSTTTS